MPPEQLAVTYDGRPKSVLIDRMDWARSYAKLGGALDSPRRGLFVLSNLGKHILSLPEGDGRAQVAQLDRDVRAARRRQGAAANSGELAEQGDVEQYFQMVHWAFNPLPSEADQSSPLMTSIIKQSLGGTFSTPPVAVSSRGPRRS